jgi:hypothetical protein
MRDTRASGRILSARGPRATSARRGRRQRRLPVAGRDAILRAGPKERFDATMDYDLEALGKVAIRSTARAVSIHRFQGCDLIADSEGYLGLAVDGEAVVERVFIHADWLDDGFAGAPFEMAARENGVGFSCLAGAEPIAVDFASAETGSGLRIETRIETSRERDVRRDALVLKFAFPVREAYLPNGRALAAPNAGQAWLGAGAVVFAGDRIGAGVQGPGDFSSLEILPKNKELWINSEYRYDHPFVAPPSGEFTWHDVSAERYAAGAARGGRFRLDILAADRPIVRPMLAPAGAQSVFVWTEHACNCIRDIHPAIYFGHQDIRTPEKAVGGFAKHRIPVTKSVFYCNPGSVVNSVDGPGHGRPMVSIEESRDFFEFLSSLQRSGRVEIVPHSISPSTTRRAAFEDGLKFMTGAFDSKTWIDHSVFKGAELRGGEDNFLAHGLDPASPHCRKDLWERYGIKYFWNHALEYIEGIPQRAGEPKRNGARSLLAHAADFAAHNVRKLSSAGRKARRFVSAERPAKPGDEAHDKLSLDHFSRPRSWPSPLWWRNKSKSGELISWGTRLPVTSNYSKETGPEIHRQVEALLENWGISLYHAYPARSDTANAAWTLDASGKFAVAEDFDRLLARMGELRDAGLLYLGTVREIMAHWTALEKISWAPESERRYRVTNRNDFAVAGVTFGVRNCAAVLHGAALPARSVGSDRIYRLDLGARASVAIDLDPES